jgi:hypothetical protein
LGQFRYAVAVASESNPLPDVPVVQDVVLRSRWDRRCLWWNREA